MMRLKYSSQYVVIGIFISLAYAQTAAAAFPGANGKILFVSNQSDDFEIHTINLNGTDARQLTNDSTPIREPIEPSWSPDGTMIVFAASPIEVIGGRADIFVINANGNNLTNLTNSPLVNDHEPRWSPDGQNIVFISGSEIYTIALNDNEPQQLTNDGAIEKSGPAWSPNGTKIAFVELRNGNYDIYTMNTDGNGKENLTNSPTHHEQEPDWSPDGTKLTFSRYTVHGGETRIHTINANSSDLRMLTPENIPSPNFSPIWSPDGTKILFGSNGEVYVMDTDGNNASNFTNNGSGVWEYFPDWQSTPARRTPVILIPGILGSQFVEDAWRLDPIFHTYDNLWVAMQNAGYEIDSTLFAFPYNWRLSSTINAGLLKNKIQDVRQLCQCTKVDVVAHSQGGLVTRSYIEGDEYQNDIDQLIFLATPHRGASEAYLAWAAGESGPGVYNAVIEKIFSLEAALHGYIKPAPLGGITGDVFRYIQNRPVESVRELLPIYNYLRENDTLVLRSYSNNYPTNLFLEELNSSAKLARLAGVNLTNIIGYAGENTTIDTIRVTDEQFADGKWEHGYPEHYSVPFTDHGLELSAGDTTVPAQSNRDFLDTENMTVLLTTHRDIVTDAQKLVIKELTGVESEDEVRLSTFDKFLFIGIYSPADFIITAPDGKRLGASATGTPISEIEGAFYTTLQAEPEFAVIPNPMEGKYVIELKGTGTGEYALSTSYVDEAQSIEKRFVSTIETYEIQDIQFTYTPGAQEGPLSELAPADLNAFRAVIEQAYALGQMNKYAYNTLLRELDNLERGRATFAQNKERVELDREEVLNRPGLSDAQRQKLLTAIEARIRSWDERIHTFTQTHLGIIDTTAKNLLRRGALNEESYEMIVETVSSLDL